MAGQSEKGGSGRPSSFRRWGMLATGIGGVAVLLSLCLWQARRLEWKEGVIATLEARLAAAPVPLPAALDPATQEFSRVRLTGRFDGAKGANGAADAPFITTLRPHGPGYRIIQPFETAKGRRVMVDRGYVPVGEKNEGGAAVRPTPAPEGEIEVVGALRWPEEGGEGPDFGARDNVWTERDLSEMAAIFGAEPVLVVAETSTAVGDWPVPTPIAVIDVPNNHLQYAITWGGLAAVWAAMTGVLLFRRR